jgi:hypothetical protein
MRSWLVWINLYYNKYLTLLIVAKEASKETRKSNSNAYLEPTYANYLSVLDKHKVLHLPYATGILEHYVTLRDVQI